MTLSGMEITLLYVPGCPHWRTARERVDEALRSIGEHAAVEVRPVTSDEHARRIGFQGSPTILVGGRDPFAEEGGTCGLTCRLYRSPTGTQGAPSVAQLVAVLR
jgi:hypothetical protein